jgi:hypothetical protein
MNFQSNALKALHPDLRPYLVRTKTGHALSSPLLTVVEIQTGNNCGSIPWINEQYRNNKLLAEGRLAKRDWAGYIFLTNRRFRIHAFSKIHRQLTDEEYWKLLNQVWTDSETIWRANMLWLLVLVSRPATRHLFMSPEDQALLASLPATLTIYRGYQPGKNPDGFSWTLSRDVAEKLSNNGKGSNLFDHNLPLTGGKVRRKTVKKSDVFAYTNSRQEQETILLWNGRKYV